MVETPTREPYGAAAIPRKVFPETAIDPEIPIIDSHHHLMHRPTNRYLMEDILADTLGGHRIVATVYCESRAMLRADAEEDFASVGETEFANGVAAMSASGIYGPTRVCAAIVGFADLSADRVGAVLDAHVRAGGGRLRGIRQGAYWDASEEVYRFVSMRPPRGLLTTDAFRRGMGELVRRDLSFDAVVFHHQLPEVVDLARAFPDGRIILNHMGFALGVGPYVGRRDDVFREWKAHLTGLASCENVVVKAGGLGIPLWGFDFPGRKEPPRSDDVAAAWRPYLETCIEIFGPERCMFESNFPADRVSCDYVTLWNALKLIVRSYSADEKHELFYGTAERVYRPELGRDNPA